MEDIIHESLINYTTKHTQDILQRRLWLFDKPLWRYTATATVTVFGCKVKHKKCITKIQNSFRERHAATEATVPDYSKMHHKSMTHEEEAMLQWLQMCQTAQRYATRIKKQMMHHKESLQEWLRIKLKLRSDVDHKETVRRWYKEMLVSPLHADQFQARWSLARLLPCQWTSPPFAAHAENNQLDEKKLEALQQYVMCNQNAHECKKVTDSECMQDVGHLTA